MVCGIVLPRHVLPLQSSRTGKNAASERPISSVGALTFGTLVPVSFDCLLLTVFLVVLLCQLSDSLRENPADSFSSIYIYDNHTHIRAVSFPRLHSLTQLSCPFSFLLLLLIDTS